MVKPNVALGKLMNAWCSRSGVDPEKRVVQMFYGNMKIESLLTPIDYGMHLVDGDIRIKVTVEAEPERDVTMLEKPSFLSGRISYK